MEVETLTDDGKLAIVGLLNRALIVEYDFILNYPRMMDKLVNYDGINDEMLKNNLMRLGKESMKHFNQGVKTIERLGGEPSYQIGTIERLEDVEALLMKQLAKEKEAISIYKEAIMVIHKNKKKSPVRDFFGRLIHANDDLPIEITANEVLDLLNLELVEETKHVKIVEDSIAILQTYLNK